MEVCSGPNRESPNVFCQVWGLLSQQATIFIPKGLRHWKIPSYNQQMASQPSTPQLNSACLQAENLPKPHQMGLQKDGCAVKT